MPAQLPEAAAGEIRRIGGRDEFVGVFLPGAARIPYGNPVYDPIWAACNDLGLPVGRSYPLREHRDHRADHGCRNARLLRRVSHPLRIGDVRALRLDPLPRRLRAVPEHERCDGGRGARAVRRAPLATRHELEELPQRDPVVQEAAVGVRLGARPLRNPATRVAGGPGSLLLPRFRDSAPKRP